jgi:hypothetical protein
VRLLVDHTGRRKVMASILPPGISPLLFIRFDRSATLLEAIRRHVKGQGIIEIDMTYRLEQREQVLEWTGKM